MRSAIWRTFCFLACCVLAVSAARAGRVWEAGLWALFAWIDLRYMLEGGL